MVVSSETGVRWRLASPALVQHAKLQRHLLGACVKRGNRGECCALLLGDSSAVCCLSSPTHACTPALHFLASGDINTYTLNMHAHSLMFMFLSWGHDGTQQATLPGIRSSRRKASIFPKSQSAASCKNTPTCCVFFKWPLLRASVFTNVQAVAWDTYTHAGSQRGAGIALLIWPQCESHVREDSCASSWTCQPLAPPPAVRDKAFPQK